LQQRPDSLPSVTRCVEINCGKMYVVVTFSRDIKPIEVFAYLGKSGKCTAAQIDALSISISLGLRSGVDVNTYIKHLKPIKCQETSFTTDGHPYTSCGNVIARVLETVQSDQEILRYVKNYWSEQ